MNWNKIPLWLQYLLAVPIAVILLILVIFLEIFMRLGNLKDIEYEDTREPRYTYPHDNED